MSYLYGIGKKCCWQKKRSKDTISYIIIEVKVTFPIFVTR